MKIDSLDHPVLTVREVGTTIAFHVDVFGMESACWQSSFHHPVSADA